MRDVLMTRFEFDPSHIKLLTDEHGSSIKPTGANIKRALSQMVDKAESGDVLFFHYSGHGTRIPSLSPGHHSQKDEAIVPCDFNLITGKLTLSLIEKTEVKNTFRVYVIQEISDFVISKD